MGNHIARGGSTVVKRYAAKFSGGHGSGTVSAVGLLCWQEGRAPPPVYDSTHSATLLVIQIRLEW